MDRFSELIKRGIASFEYTPIANSNQCPDCRDYNNRYSMATDTHMTCLDDGRKVITGHIIGQKEKFDKFIWSKQFMGVSFQQYFAEWMEAHGYSGEYSLLNGDAVYILSARKPHEDAPAPQAPMPELTSYTTESNGIPTSIKYLSKRGYYEDVKECIADDIYETVKNLNNSKYIYGNNWKIAYMSEGVRIVGQISGENYILS